MKRGYILWGFSDQNHSNFEEPAVTTETRVEHSDSEIDANEHWGKEINLNENNEKGSDLMRIYSSFSLTMFAFFNKSQLIFNPSKKL